MTPQEIIELFKRHEIVKFIIPGLGETELKTAELKQIVEALEKQTPKKVVDTRQKIVPKAILELKAMPKDCSECPCSTLTQSWIAKEKRVARHLVCEILKLFCPSNGRHKDCPIKEVEDHA